MRERRPHRLASIALLAVALAPAAVARAQETPRDPTDTVRAFTEAFAAREVDGLLALAHPEIEWLSVTGAEVAVETRGREALGKWLRSYYASCPSCRSTTEIYQVVGPYVSALERATWEKDGSARGATSLAVYEVAEGMVRRVWYWPATSEGSVAGEEAPSP